MTTFFGRRLAAQQALLAAASGPPVSEQHRLKLLQVWQWEGVKLDDAFLQSVKDLGFTGLLVKALDGAVWMSNYDSSAYALSEVNDVSWQSDLCHEHGLYYFAWTNPLQMYTGVQSHLTAEISKRCDGVFLDVEPYAQFWGPWAPAGLASSFMQAVRKEAPESFLVLQPDPRVNALASIRINEWAPYVDALSGQHYWSDFHTDPTQELAHAQALGSLYRLPLLPTLPGNAPQGSFPVDVISEFPGYVVWRLGSTPANTLALLGSLPVAGLATQKLRVPKGVTP